jgi:hypothetical protein
MLFRRKKRLYGTSILTEKRVSARQYIDLVDSGTLKPEPGVEIHYVPPRWVNGTRLKGYFVIREPAY